MSSIAMTTLQPAPSTHATTRGTHFVREARKAEVVENGSDRKLVRFVPEPADIGYDTKRGIVAVPLGMMDHVEFFALPASLTRRTAADSARR